MKKFEYITVSCIFLLRDFELNSKGKEGWELCGCIHILGKYVYYFKREIIN